MEKKKIATVDEYIASQPENVRDGLEKIRAAIHKAAPKAEEVISYSMPAFRLDGILVWFSVTKKHYGFYPFNKTILAFKSKLKSYDQSKGTVRFPLDEPLPLKLITEMVKFRVKENTAKQKEKKSGKKKALK